MKKLLISATALALLLSASASRSFALSGPAAQSAPAATQAKDTTPPSYDMKPQALLDLDGMHQKFVALATAVPAEKYSWRPAEGVRSIGEVFLHVAGCELRDSKLDGHARASGLRDEELRKVAYRQSPDH